MIKAGEPVDLAEMVAETWGVDQDSGAILCIGGHEARTLRAESPLFMDTARQHNAARGIQRSPDLYKTHGPYRYSITFSSATPWANESPATER
jgi:hypothetical protein